MSLVLCTSLYIIDITHTLWGQRLNSLKYLPCKYVLYNGNSWVVLLPDMGNRWGGGIYKLFH